MAWWRMRPSWTRTFTCVPAKAGTLGRCSRTSARARPAGSPPSPGRSGAECHTRAFVQVQNGCDHACTFCVIPQGRGPSRSRRVADVLADVARHLAAGAREVVLTGVDVTSWGADLPD